jgi:hypothetical protein
MKRVLDSFTNLWVNKSPCREFRPSAGLRKAGIPNLEHLQVRGRPEFRIPSICKVGDR